MTTFVSAGYRAYTGYIFSTADADAYNAAVAKYAQRPTEANANGCHNLFQTIVETPRKESDGLR